MEINQMKYIVCIANNNFNISKAAEKLYITQPALGKTIKNIELMTGIEIFTRKKGRLTGFTPIGKIIYDNSIQIINIENQIQKNIIDYKKKESNYISIGILSVFMPILYEKINTLSHKCKENKNIIIDIVEYNYWDLMKKFEEDEQIDIIITVGYNENNNETINHTILDSSYVAIYDKNNHHFENNSIKYSDLNKKTLIYPSTLSKSKTLIDGILDNNKVECKRKIHLMNPESVLQTIVNTDYLAILPQIFYDINSIKYNNYLNIAEFKVPIPWHMDIVINKKNYNKSKNVFEELYNTLKNNKLISP